MRRLLSANHAGALRVALRCAALLCVAALLAAGALGEELPVPDETEGVVEVGAETGQIVRLGEDGNPQILQGDVRVDAEDGLLGASFTMEQSGIVGVVCAGGETSEASPETASEAEAASEPEPEAVPAFMLAAAAADDYITELIVTPSYVENYGKVRIGISFSDGSPDEHVFHAGDTLAVTWPSDGDAILKGYQRTFPLVNAEGVTYAEVVVSATGAVLTFNEAVESLYDVHGSFYFEALAINNSPTEEEDVQTVTVVAGGHTADVSIHKNASSSGESGDAPDFRKDADFIGGGYTWDEEYGWVMSLDPDDPTYVQWVLTANENCHSVASDIEIADTAGPGQRLDTGYLLLYCSGKNQATFSGTVESVTAQFQAAFPGCSLALDEAGSLEWTITQAAADETYWCLVYRCDITDFGLQYFENAADITWEEPDGKTFSAHDDARFYNVNYGGGVSVLPRGVLQVTKKVSGTDLTVAGVTFVVEKYVDGEWILQGTITTGADGTATMTRLGTGQYRLYETDVPAHLAPRYTADAPCFFEIDVEDPERQSLDLCVENALKTTRVVAHKVWESADGTADAGEHPTVWFRLYRQSGAQTQPVAVGEPVELPDGTTEAVWEDLPECDVFGNAYTYSVREVDAEGNDWAPGGYSGSADGLTVVNRRSEVAITLRKTGPDGAPLVGAVFELAAESDGVFVALGDAIAVDSADGVVIPGIEPGRRYRLEEKQAPDGYVFAGKYTWFVVDGSGSIVLTDEDGNPADPGYATVSGDGLAISVVNTPGRLMPATGGPGRYHHAALLLPLLAVAAMVALRMRRSCGRE